MKKAFLSIVLTLALIVSCTIGISAIKLDNLPDYEGNVLLAVNTEAGTTNGRESFTATLASGVSNNSEQNIEINPQTNDNSEPYKIDTNLPEIVPQSSSPIDIKPQNKAAENYKSNDTKSIVSAYATNHSNNSVNLTCLYIGSHCTVWVQNDCNKNITLSQKQAKQIGEKFDSYKSKLDNFLGNVSIDEDGDDKIAIFCYDISNEYEVNRKVSGYIGGYFWGKDLVDANGYVDSVFMGENSGNGNSIDCIHIDTFPCMGSSADPLGNIENCYSTLVHEYQHFVNLSYSLGNKTNDTYLSFSETYINEAFSMATEHVLCGSGSVSSRISTFNNMLATNKGYSLTYWNNNDGANSYGLPYVFGQYIRTRYAQLTNDKSGTAPGSSIYRLVLESRNQNNDEDTLGIIANILYPTSAYPSLNSTQARKDQLLMDFWIAVYALEDSGIYGFNGESFADKIDVSGAIDSSLPRSSSSVGYGGARYYYINGGKKGTAKINSAGTHMKFCALDSSIETSDIVLLLDYSTSMSDEQISKMKTAAYLFCDQIAGLPGVQIALVPYATYSKAILNLTSDKTTILNAVSNMSSTTPAYSLGSLTYMAEALNTADSILSAGDSDKKIILLMTDGMPNGDIYSDSQKYSDPAFCGVYDTAAEIINKYEKANSHIDIYTFGIYPSQSDDSYEEAKKLLKDITEISNNNGTYSIVDDPNQLVFEFANVGGIVSGDSNKMLMNVDCPVEVTVYPDKPVDIIMGFDEIIVSEPETLDSRQGNSTASFGSMVVTRRGTSYAPDNNISCLLDMNNDYIFVIEGLADGEVEFSTIIDGVNWKTEAIPVTASTVITGEVEIAENGKDEVIDLMIDDDGDGTTDRTVSIDPNKENSGDSELSFLETLLATPLLIFTAIGTALSVFFGGLLAFLLLPFTLLM